VPESADIREYSDRVEAESPERFSTLADKLRGALSSRQKP
jgi:hypothetical protein